MRRPLRSVYRFLCHLLYNRLAWTYDPVSWTVSLGKWDAWRRAALPFVTGDRILEVGFGSGDLLPLLQRRQRRVYGIEPSPAMQRIASRKLRKWAIFVPRVQGVAQQLPFVDNTFDTIVSAFPASFILDSRAHLEFARCLRPGGKLIIVDIALTTSAILPRFLYHLIFPSDPASSARLNNAILAAGLSATKQLVGRGRVRSLVLIARKPPST